MQIIHESGHSVKLDGIIEIGADNTPVRVILKGGEFRKIRKGSRGYWFKYHNHKFYLAGPAPDRETRFVRLHPGQCLKCARLWIEGSQCATPAGYRSFRGHTGRDCQYYEPKIV